MNRIKPPALKKGDLIGIMSPSTRVDKKSLTPALRMLADYGFDIEIHPQTLKKYKSSAGTREEKLAALSDLFSRKDIKAVFASGGGNHSLDLLDGVDYKLIARKPKIFMGFSDTTALLNAFNARAGLVTFHGPVLKWLPKVDDPDIVFDLLAGEKINFKTDDAFSLRNGVVTAPLVGGNLAMFNALLGTPYMPRLDGAILFLEDINEELSHLDRVFTRMRLAGVLDKIAGLVLGQFTDCKDTGHTPYGFKFEDILAKNFGMLKIPVVMNMPFGHCPELCAVPIGTPVRLNAHGVRVTFRLDEPAVSL